MLVNGSAAPFSEASNSQGAAFGRLIIQGDVSGTGRIMNLDRMKRFFGQSRCGAGDRRQCRNQRTSQSHEAVREPWKLLIRQCGDSLHYQGSGHNLEMTLNGPPSDPSDAVVFLQQATTAIVQIDSSASASVTGPVEVQGLLTVIISGAPGLPAVVSSTPTGSNGSRRVPPGVVAVFNLA